MKKTLKLNNKVVYKVNRELIKTYNTTQITAGARPRIVLQDSNGNNLLTSDNKYLTGDL